MYNYNTEKLIDALLECHKEYLNAERIRASSEYSIENKDNLVKRTKSRLEAFKRRLVRLVDLHEQLYYKDREF